jgi:hypothetical protein
MPVVPGPPPKHMSVKEAKTKPAGNYATTAVTVSAQPLRFKTGYMVTRPRDNPTQRQFRRSRGGGRGKSPLRGTRTIT